MLTFLKQAYVFLQFFYILCNAGRPQHHNYCGFRLPKAEAENIADIVSIIVDIPSVCVSCLSYIRVQDRNVERSDWMRDNWDSDSQIFIKFVLFYVDQSVMCAVLKKMNSCSYFGMKTAQ